jgi:predicted alpha-1,2-mannosidase
LIDYKNKILGVPKFQEINSFLVEKLFYFLFFIAVVFSFHYCSRENRNSNSETPPVVKYVNPLIGTAPSNTLSALKHGTGNEINAQVVPFVTVPFGMTNWTPQTRATEEKCISPYYYKDSVINGFRGSHWLSGSCVQDYGSFSIMPISGKLNYLPDQRGSKFSHADEISTPYYYKVFLKDYNVTAEMTATTRAGLFKFTFQKGSSHIVIEPNSNYAVGYVKILTGRNEVIGFNPVHRIYQGWGELAGFKGYFVARFSKPFSKFGVYNEQKNIEGQTEISNSKNIGAYVSFDLAENESVFISIGTSFTSIDEARMNLDNEIKDYNFDAVKNKLFKKWEEILSKVKVEGGNEGDKIKFYTALYHCFLQPRIYNDVDGSYVKFSGGKQVLNSKGENYYCDFSMWDTYRALHPLFNLLIPNVNKDMMKSILLKGEEGGWLPIFPCWNSYTSAMVGDHAIAAIADAFCKDVINLSPNEYNLLLKNAVASPKSYRDYGQGKGRRALNSYLKYGYIPLEDSVKESFHKNEQVSRTLEYAYDDFALSRITSKIGSYSDFKSLSKRAMNYKNVFDKQNNSVRGKFKDGSWTQNFNKLDRMPYITEGTPWQYTWYVPQDVEGLIKLMGGEEKFNENLDDFFAKDQYWHGNEPGQQIPFLYNYSGQPWKTQKKVSEIMEQEYGLGPGGLSGNDDGGQMSAWYVFAALGFYPVCPSVPEYVISGPHFDKITIKLPKNKILVITAPGASEGKNYIKQVKFNGYVYDRNYLNHFDLMNGGTLEFMMSKKPNEKWGTLKSSRPSSLSN